MVRDEGNGAVGGEGVPEGLLSSPQSRRGQRVREIADRMREVPEKLNEANDKFIGFVREKPLVALGVACAAGYLLGRLLKRVV